MSNSQLSEKKDASRERLAFMLICVLVVALFCVQYFFKGPHSFFPGKVTKAEGIVYPLNHQKFSQQEIVLSSQFRLNPQTLLEALSLNQEPVTQSDVLISELEYYHQENYSYRLRIETVLTEGDTLEIKKETYNRGLSSNGEPLSYFIYHENNEEEHYFQNLPQNYSWSYASELPYFERVDRNPESPINEPVFTLYTLDTNLSQDDIVLIRALNNTTKAYSSCYYSSFSSSSLKTNTVEYLPFTTQQVNDTTVSLQSNFFKDKGTYCYFVAHKENQMSLKALFSTNYLPAQISLEAQESFVPDYDFKSIIAVYFDSPFLDTKAQRSKKEQISYRKQQKKRLAALVTTDPPLEINFDEIVLHEYKALLPLPLDEETRYTVTVASGADVFGEYFEEQSLVLNTKQFKYLGLRQNSKQTVFPQSSLPKLSVLHHKVDSTTLKLCRINAENSAKIEHITAQPAEYEKSNHFFLEGVDGLAVEECWNYTPSFDVDTFQTPIDFKNFSSDQLPNGFYYLTFAFSGDRQISSSGYTQKPLLFTVVNSHISMKISKNGKAFFWVNDIETGNPVSDISLYAAHNQFEISQSKWSRKEKKSVSQFFNPLESQIYSEKIFLGKTDEQGVLQVDLDQDDYNNSFQNWWDVERYQSLLVSAESDKYYSVVINKWNSGIASWNFGFSPVDIYTGVQQQFLGFIYPDRKLYLPGETVSIKALIRQEDKGLKVPPESPFSLRITNPKDEMVLDQEFSSNQFGSISTEYAFSKETPLGNYRLQLYKSLEDGSTEYIADTTVLVEEFKKPSYKVGVELSSLHIDNGFLVDPKATLETNSWGYSYKTYTQNIDIKADVLAQYFSGGNLSQRDIRYTVFKQAIYDNNYWYDCFYGCYFEAPKQYWTSGTEKLDESGRVSLHIPLEHKTQWDDYRYHVQVTVSDTSGEQVSGVGTLDIKIPEDLKQYNPNSSLELQVDKQFVQDDDPVTVTLKSQKTWNDALNSRYKLQLKRREYAVNNQEQYDGQTVSQLDFKDETIWKIPVTDDTLQLLQKNKLNKTFSFPRDGEFFLELLETNRLGEPVVITSKKLYAYASDKVSNAQVVADNKITVLSEKTIYSPGETARLFIRLPYAPAKILLTTERDQVIDSQIIDVSHNIFIHEFVVDNQYSPNAYVSVIAVNPLFKNNTQPDYKVGYAEIITDKSHYQLSTTVETDHVNYEPRDQVKLKIKTQNKNKIAQQSEVSVAVVDEALISMVGNIDLDIIPQFFKKVLFQTHTALTAVAMNQHLYFARKGLVGGSGGKDGGDSVFTRSYFKNTAFYAANVYTDDNGEAELSFDLPDNTGEFRVIAVGHTSNNLFGAGQTTFSVRKQFVVEDRFPQIIRPGDQLTVGANIINNTRDKQTLQVSLDVNDLDIQGETRLSVDINPESQELVYWPVKLNTDKLDGDIEYTISALTADGKQGDRIQKTLVVEPLPLVVERSTYQQTFTAPIEWSKEIKNDTDKSQSKVTLTLSSSVLSGVERSVVSLMQYPYGCLEQTISSTMPNILVGQFKVLQGFNIPEEVIQKNIRAGVSRLKQMQLADGSFSYWLGLKETAHHMTPVAVMSLMEMQEYGINDLDGMINKGLAYIEKSVLQLEGEISQDRLSQLVQELRPLSLLPGDNKAFGVAYTLIKNRLSQLTILEKMFFAGALQTKNNQLYQVDINQILSELSGASFTYNPRNWYWNELAMKALYANLLQKTDSDPKKVDNLIQELYQQDLSDLRYSTRTKTLIFRTLLDYIQNQHSRLLKKPVSIRFSLGDKSGRVRISSQNSFAKRSYLLSDLIPEGETINLSITPDEALPFSFYLDLTVEEQALDPLKTKAIESPDVSIKRQYFKLGKVEPGESYWDVAKQDLAPVSGNTLTQGETYLVRVTLDYQEVQHEVAVESFLPSGLQLLNPRFTTDETQAKEAYSSWYFEHQELRKDRFFTSARKISGEPIEIEYYVRAEYSGEFVEPPVLTYPMYRPSVMSGTPYRMLTITPTSQ